ncbi:MAG: peptide chain release factor N(5)-glutamine methyltransferase, partial [Rickettsiales bacterium]|nr:peptide chain release factor N(5)-glutamine methyltransferase [Rickettsiales bacterium]
MKTSAAFEMLKSSSNARDAKIVLRHIMRHDAFEIPDVRLSPLQSFKVWNAARKLRLKVPVAKITGMKEFYGLSFETGRATLDPRPESETIIEALKKYFPKDARIRILDCGTGTGCLIAAALKEFPNASGVAIDISHSAVRCAARNMLKLGLFGRAEIKRRDFGRALTEKFDAIISNPPYIATGDARVDAGARHDPKAALYAGADGLAAYRALAKSIPEMLNAGGKVFLEIGEGQE